MELGMPASRDMAGDGAGPTLRAFLWVTATSWTSQACENGYYEPLGKMVCHLSLYGCAALP